MPQGARLYWPRSDKVSVATTWSLHRMRRAQGSRGMHVKMFLSVYVQARAPPASRGALTDFRKEPTVADAYFWAFMYCLICFSPPHGIGLLLRNDWQTRRRRKKSVFSVYAAAIPLPPQVQFRLGKTQGNYSVCLALFMASECWSCLSLFLKCMSAVNALLKDNHCRGCT